MFRAASSKATPPAPAVPTLSGTLTPGAGLVLYGLRIWAAVCLSLAVAFWLELENPSWAGTSAAIVCQPVLGASLRKGWFRLIGTVIGAFASVVLTACFPQNRAEFLLGIAVWGGACAFTSTVLHNYASYAAALAGYTTAIVAGDELGVIGGANGQAFNLAVTRASEICIGIICASLIMATTDLGGTRRRLAAMLRSLASEITDGLLTALETPSAGQDNFRAGRRELIRRVAALDVTIEQASGEIGPLPFRPLMMQQAVDGLFAGLSAWRVIATHLERDSQQNDAEQNDPGQSDREQSDRGQSDQQEAGCVLSRVPEGLRQAARHGNGMPPGVDVLRLRDEAVTATRRLAALPARTASLRLLSDGAARGLRGISGALIGIAALSRPLSVGTGPRSPRLRVPDFLPAVINGIRAFLTIGIAELIWIETAWPGGAGFILFAAVTITLFAPLGDAAFGTAQTFMLGTATTAALAATIAFAVLPGQPTFAGFCGAIGVVLVPGGALSAQSWRQPFFTALAMNFIPLLQPANTMSYDPGQFYNNAAALLAGVGLSMLMLRLLPPLAPEMRTRRLLALTLRDLRRLATGAMTASAVQWEGRVYGRLSALPDQSAPLQRARLAAAVSVGSEIIRLRHAASHFEMCAELAPALSAIAQGDSAAAIDALDRFDRVVAALPTERPRPGPRLRLRAHVQAIAEALALHAAYFDAGGAA